MFTGDVNAASESPAGGRGHDAEPALSPEELRTELHPQDEDGSAGKRTTCRLCSLSATENNLCFVKVPLDQWAVVA